MSVTAASTANWTRNLGIPGVSVERVGAGDLSAGEDSDWRNMTISIEASSRAIRSRQTSAFYCAASFHKNDGSTCVGMKLEGSAHCEAGYDIRTVQELLDYSGVWTTMIYTHVLNQGGRGVRSPADFDSLDSE